MSFVKQFRLDNTDGFIIQNTSGLEAYMKEKIEHFSKHENYSSKSEVLALLDEINKMCDYDMSTATFDTTAADDLIGFDLAKHKKSFIYFYNICYILGTIIFYVFDKPGNKPDKIFDGVNGLISTSDMFNEAYSQLVSHKSEKMPAYGATLIFATLLEHSFKLRIKIEYLSDWHGLLQQKITSGNVTLDENEKKLFEALQAANSGACDALGQYDSVIASTTLQYDLLLRTNTIGSDCKIKKLILNELTFNEILKSRLANDKVAPCFLEICRKVFYSWDDHLNLRNNLAHCNYGYQDYYGHSVTALLYFLLMQVILDNFLK